MVFCGSKNILDKFNPGTRQMINAGKAYLKALHGAAAASRVYVDAITKLARQAQQATWSGCNDIGSALMQIVEVYKETQTQQMNILKAFYVDVLVPLETNLEKDTKVVQSEQKRFLHNHKQHIESYSKAEATVKKYRKKQGRKNCPVDKELKSMQVLEDEKNKLDEFCEQSLKHAITQERRRYGFVLERQTSLAKHNLAFYEKQQALVEKYMNSWNEIAKCREQIPESVESMFTTKMSQMNFYPEDQLERSISPEEEDVASMNTQLRKSKSIDSACMENQNGQEINTEVKHPLVKAKSDYNMNGSTLTLHRNEEINSNTLQRPKSMAIGDHWENKNLVRALYSYLTNGENQLSFLKGDIISTIGERNKGWQYGENVRTKASGWFPMAYTEGVVGEESILNSPRKYRKNSFVSKSEDIYDSTPSDEANDIDKVNSKFMTNKQPTHKFGDSVVQRHQNQGRRVQENLFNPVPPPVMPAPIVPVSNGETIQRESRASPAQNNKKAQNGNASLHSSNDSGFSNDPPPAPDVDYSDDEINSRGHYMKKSSDAKSTKSMPNGKKKEFSSSVCDWLNGEAIHDYHSATMCDKRRHVPIRQSSSVGHLVTLGRLSNHAAQSEKDVAVYDKKIKRTKSLWKFKKADDVLEGMSLWKHRSLVDINNQQNGGGGDPSSYSRGTPVLDKRMAVTREISVDSDDEHTIMNGVANNHQAKNKPASSKYQDESEESDQESCIVVDDHRKTDTVNSKLPRTHLTKTNSSTSVKAENGYTDYKDNESDNMVFESNKLQTFKYNRIADSSWYDSWGERRKK
ncbi:uncharacterized protein IRSp53 isoform X2 [Planococcus citri]|uniref:uncharacterized protein IRSp53 isoform X2 n=1 Tax=Planococcus citri TaxID=170843 RepID=UPI0031F8A42F